MTRHEASKRRSDIALLVLVVTILGICFMPGIACEPQPVSCVEISP